MGASELTQFAQSSAIAAFNIPQDELIETLEGSLYPGASHNSIKLALGYCKASNLDPMMKPVHIVPIWDKNAKRMRDTVMPGIGLYRTNAARTGAYAGMTEVEYGPLMTEELGGVRVVYPEWAKVTVEKLMPNGTVARFTATEYWIENYAVAGKDTAAPNNMWRKRPRAQLGKCVEAQALRKAFPESVGAQPTAEEMEGRHTEIDMGAAEQPEQTGQQQAAHGIKRKSDGAAAEQKPADVASDVVDGKTGEIISPAAQQTGASTGEAAAQQQTKQSNPPPAEPVDDAGRASPPASSGLINTVKAKVKAAGLSDEEALKAHRLQSFDGISTATANKVIAWAKANKE
ncbi:phage recombination protein Bet [Burkholderia sp. Ac-20349]|uniref:phage recombination protein Bet n=1 Tax=Burkholderia sp. Ac-20349 TaxID=2703893 RepID=UPI00197C769D|nr:phage recombination protein Bet [Burkholderia sp. Ac-20349]MBN3839245.1 phage recombination protein Bet [Burkholderia sp. Ac-20349]